ncbi:MAG: hypothetical protein QM762_22885 [Chryseolinea sp.]
MKYLPFFLIFFLLAGCKVNHQHDGVYIAEKPNLGVMKAWIVEGNEITYYLMGEVKVARCKQYEDRIEVADDIVYRIDKDGNLVLPGKSGKTGDEKLIKRSSKTKFTHADLERMIDEAMPPPGVLQDHDATH